MLLGDERNLTSPSSSAVGRCSTSSSSRARGRSSTSSCSCGPSAAASASSSSASTTSPATAACRRCRRPPSSSRSWATCSSSYRELQRLRPLPGRREPLRRRAACRGARSHPRVGRRPIRDADGAAAHRQRRRLRAHRRGSRTGSSRPTARASSPAPRCSPSAPGVRAHRAAARRRARPRRRRPPRRGRRGPAAARRRGRSRPWSTARAACPVSWRQFLPARARRRGRSRRPAPRVRAPSSSGSRGSGVPIDHLDTHQHLHLWPIVREVVLELAGRARGRSRARARTAAAGASLALRHRPARCRARAPRRRDRLGVPRGLGRTRPVGPTRLAPRLAARARSPLAPPATRRSSCGRTRASVETRSASATAGATAGATSSPCSPVRRRVTSSPAQGFALGTFADLARDRVSAFTPVPPAGRAALALFADAPLGDATPRRRPGGGPCPFAEVVERVVPTSGDVLDIGCGHGLFASYLALEPPGRRVVGVDLDDRQARRRRDGRRARARRRRVARAPVSHPVARCPTGPWDAITIVDVLYLLPADARNATLSSGRPPSSRPADGSS